MYGFKALIFDVDGTLADTERDGHRPAFNDAFAAAGLDWNWDPVRYGELLRVTGGKERIRDFMASEGIQPDPDVELDGFIAGLHRAKTDCYLARLRTGTIPLRPGVLRLLREARAAGIRLAIATTTTPDNVTELLDRAGEPGLRDWFEVIAAGESVPRKKPAPDIYQLVLARLGLAPSDCIACEDSEHGVNSALQAGLRAILVTLNDYTRDQNFARIPLVVDQLGEPDAPPRILTGTLGGSTCVDLAALDRLHRQVYPGQVHPAA